MKRALKGRWKVVNENYTADDSTLEHRRVPVVGRAKWPRPWTIYYIPFRCTTPIMSGRYRSYREAIVDINTIEWHVANST